MDWAALELEHHPHQLAVYFAGAYAELTWLYLDTRSLRR